MHHHHTLVAIALTLTVAAGGLGCGGGATASCDDCGEFREVMGAFCDVIDRCPISTYPIAYRSRDECAAILYFFLTCRLVDRELDDQDYYSLEEQVPVIDGDQAAACIAWLKTASCEALTGGGECTSGECDAGVESPCVGLLAGMFEDTSGVGAGQSCESDSCMEGLHCADAELRADAGVRTCRVCKAPLAIGEACNYGSVPCAQGSWCKGAVDGTSACAALVADGGACTSASECLSGFCNYPKSVCDGGGRDGDPCATATDCRAGYCDAASRCAPYKLNGEACAADDECANRRCDPGTSRCGLPDGATCSYSDGDCQSGYCEDTSRTCQPRKADGTACQDHTECLSEYCNYSTQTCTPHCYTTEDCDAGHYCNWSSNTCIPQQADGAYCEDDEECTSGYCNNAEKCGPPPQIGDACSGYGACPPEAYCADGTCRERKGPGASCPSLDSCMAPFFCVNGHCQLMNLQCKPARAGEMCAYLRVCDDESYCDLMGGFMCAPRAGAGESCSGSETCAASLYCASGDEGMVCAERLAAGQPCQSAAECAPGLFCALSSSGTAMACTAGPAGQPCDYDVPCPAGYFCGTRDACAPLRTLGEDCSDSWEPCVPELYCDSSDGCQPRPGAGAECDSTSGCATGYYCDSSTRVCVARAGLGQECQDYSSGVQCLEELRCDYDSTVGQDVCQAKRGLGESCSYAADCQSGVCDQSICLASNQCVMP